MIRGMVHERHNSDLRPSPEALLEAARREEGRTGKLKIFLGAAPGVGKTYEMLQQRPRQAQGWTADVVVGVVETHGRARPKRCSTASKSCPRKRIAYKGHMLEEMDIDAHHRAPAADRAGRRTGPHQCPRQPPSQALPRRRGAAVARHRRLHHRSTSSISKASTMSWRRSRTSGCARPCRIPFSTAPTTSSLSI